MEASLFRVSGLRTLADQIFRDGDECLKGILDNQCKEPSQEMIVLTSAYPQIQPCWFGEASFLVLVCVRVRVLEGFTLRCPPTDQHGSARTPVERLLSSWKGGLCTSMFVGGRATF